MSVARRPRPSTCLALGAVLLGALGSSAAVVAGCSGGEGPQAVGSAAPTVAPACSCNAAASAAAVIVDPTLLAFLSKARATHHEADLAERGGEPGQAITALLRLVEGPIPGAGAPSPEVREVLADTYSRLAELRSARADFEQAASDVTRGLELATEPTHFRGRLVEIRGLVEERRATALEAHGDRDGARQARERALDSYEQAVEIQDEVIRRALADAGAPTIRPDASH